MSWNYVDGLVAAVPTARKNEYRKHVEDVMPVFKEYGAVSVVECWGDDVPDGEVTSFPMAVKCKDDETVVFSWITWPSKEVRNQAMEKMGADSRMRQIFNDMPFDGKRLIFGGFKKFFAA